MKKGIQNQWFNQGFFAEPRTKAVRVVPTRFVAKPVIEPDSTYWAETIKPVRIEKDSSRALWTDNADKTNVAEATKPKIVTSTVVIGDNPFFSYAVLV